MKKTYRFKKEKLGELKKYGNISDISRNIGITRVHLSYVVNGHKTTGVLLASALSRYAGRKDIDYYFNEVE